MPENARVARFQGRSNNHEAVEGYRKTWNTLRRNILCAWVKEHRIERAATDLGADWS